MMRFHVIGSAGAGKTHLAAEIARRLAVPHVELDDLHWGPDWREADRDAFRADVHQALSGDTWVVDGNYSKVRDIVWERVRQVVWLDYPLSLVLWRLLGRSLRRVVTREMLWGRNRESFRGLFLSGDSLFLYVLKTHQSRRARYEALMLDPANASIEFLRLRSPRQTRQWLASLEDNRSKR